MRLYALAALVLTMPANAQKVWNLARALALPGIRDEIADDTLSSPPPKPG